MNREVFNGFRNQRRILTAILACVLLICSLSCNRNSKNSQTLQQDPLSASNLPSTILNRNGETLRVVDISSELGLHLNTITWTAPTFDIDGDGKKDLLIGRHAQGAALLFRNTGGHYSLIDDHTFLYHVDGHDCTFADVNRDGKVDLYCSVGAGRGRKIKKNQLWIQQSDSSYLNKVEEYGVTDPFGRGRHVVFFDVNRDGYPDLFVGNDAPRPDGNPTPNRLFINQEGKHFRAAPEFGLDQEIGEFCAKNFDFNNDGWEDLLVCGQAKPPSSLHLYQNIGGRKFEDVSVKLGINQPYCSDALFVDLNNDHRIDLAVNTIGTVAVQLQQKDGHFGPSVRILKDLKKGRKLASGDIDGDGDQDLYVLQGCLKNESTDHPDGILLNDGSGIHFVTLKVPQPSTGCGDLVVPLDSNDDQKTEFLVLNGFEVKGDVQVIALRPAK